MIVVTTPTGTIGRQVVQSLLGREAAVRVIVRDAARLAPALRDRVEVVEGSHGEGALVERAFAGADAVFWVVPVDFKAASVDAAYLDFTRPAAEAFGRCGVKRVVGVSALGRGVPGNAGLVTASLKMDDLIAATGVPYRALANPSFMDNILRQVPSIRAQGVFYSPLIGDRKMPSAAARDIGAVAARLLTDPTWSGHSSVAVLGPEDLSHDDMARIMADVLGRPVRFQHVAGDAFKANLLAAGMSEPMAQAMLAMMVAKNNGLDNAEPRTAEATTPTSFRQWCETVLKPAVAGAAD